MRLAGPGRARPGQPKTRAGLGRSSPQMHGSAAAEQWFCGRRTTFICGLDRPGPAGVARRFWLGRPSEAPPGLARGHPVIMIMMNDHDDNDDDDGNDDADDGDLGRPNPRVKAPR